MVLANAMKGEKSTYVDIEMHNKQLPIKAKGTVQRTAGVCAGKRISQ